MPNRSIYIRDEDLLIFDKAEELSGGNLSSAITEAVKRYVEVKELEKRSMKELIVKVRPRDRAERTLKFVGRMIASHTDTGEDDGEPDFKEVWEIYETELGNIVLVWRVFDSSFREVFSEYEVRGILPEIGEKVVGHRSSVIDNLLKEAAQVLSEGDVEFIK